MSNNNNNSSSSSSRSAHPHAQTHTPLMELVCKTYLSHDGLQSHDLFAKSVLSQSVRKHMTTVRINQTEDNTCGDGQGEVWTVFKMSDPLPPRTLLKSVRKRVAVDFRKYCSSSLFLLATRTFVRNEALRTVLSWSRRLMASMEALVLVTKRYSRTSPSRFGLAECRSGCNLHRIHDHTLHPVQHRAECDELRLELMRRRSTGTFRQRTSVT